MALTTAAPHADYATLAEFRAAIAEPAIWTFCESKANGHDFSGTPTYDAAEALMLDGYPEGRDMLLSDIAAASKFTGARINAIEYSVAGAQIDMAAYCAGAPDFYIVEGPIDTAPARVARFDISVSTSAGVKTATMRARAAGVLSWIDALEASGTRCEIVLSNGQQCSGKLFGFRLMLKRADESLDVDRIAYAMLHPSFLRRHVFRWTETQIPRSHETSGYGRALGLKPIGMPGEIYFKALHGNDKDFATPAAAAASVQRMIEAAGFLDDHGAAA